MIETTIAEPDTSPATAAPDDDQRRILILAPTGIDAHLTADFLNKANLFPHICADPSELCNEIARGCGVIILGEETLVDGSIRNLLSCLKKQPSWSDIPIILVTRGGDSSKGQLHRLSTFGPGGNVTVLERPFRPGTLVSALEVALRARQRQYEARDFVETLQRARDEAEMASRAKDIFLAALSHELRTPLSPVLLIASEFACDGRLPEEIRQNFEIIRKSIELEAQLIDDLLDLTRVTTGKLVLRREELDLHGILVDALETVRAEIQKKEIRLDLELSAAHCVVNGDAVRLQQIFWNVLKNAVKFTPDRGSIAVTARPEGDDCIVTVSDTGIGMTAEELENAFDAFRLGRHSDRAKHFGGLGLGLSISKKLVELHSGSIQAFSKGQHHGATFVIKFPLSARQGQAVGCRDRIIQPGAQAAASSFHILLVEDHAATRDVLARLLTQRRHTVIPAGSVDEAIAAAGTGHIDLVISDIGLPDGSGYQLFREIHKRFPTVKGIALSGYGMNADLNSSMDVGFSAHLTKPVRIDALETVLAKVLTR